MDRKKIAKLQNKKSKNQKTKESTKIRTIIRKTTKINRKIKLHIKKSRKKTNYILNNGLKIEPNTNKSVIKKIK